MEYNLETNEINDGKQVFEISWPGGSAILRLDQAEFTVFNHIDSAMQAFMGMGTETAKKLRGVSFLARAVEAYPKQIGRASCRERVCQYV